MKATSPLQLERYRLEKLVIDFGDEWLRAQESEPDDPRAYEARTDFDVYRAPEDERVLVRLAVESHPKTDAPPQRFNEVSIVVWGIFSLAAGTQEEAKQQLIPYNCVAILHGLARGVITSATGACVGGPFLLPSLNYVEVVKEKAKGKCESSDEKEPASEEGE